MIDLLNIDEPDNLDLIEDKNVKALYLKLYKLNYAVFKNSDTTPDNFSIFCNGAIPNKLGAGDYYNTYNVNGDRSLDDFGISKKLNEILKASKCFSQWQNAEAVNVYPIDW